MFLKSDLEKAKERKKEEYYFNIIAKELEQNVKHNPTWAKALANSNGDTEKAKSHYINYRLQSLKDDTILQEEINNQKKATKIREEQLQEEERKWKKYKEQEEQMKEDKSSLLSYYLTFLLFGLIITIFKYLFT